MQIFGGGVVEGPDRRREFGELRIRCLGQIEGRVYSVVYTRRGANRRLISARKANGREQRAYYARHP
ncbi:MAG TPA: BrnT family toxin [Stellaceae bacterium]|nr:BrnT family toxin [Stellaceae bacterium]